MKYILTLIIVIGFVSCNDKEYDLLQSRFYSYRDSCNKYYLKSGSIMAVDLDSSIYYKDKATAFYDSMVYIDKKLNSLEK